MFELLSKRWDRLKARLKTRAFKDATVEVAVTVVTATLPIWFFPTVALFLVGASYAGGLLDHSVSDGELFLFSTSLVGPLLYILFKVYEVPDSQHNSRSFKYKISLVFPHALKFASTIFLICITSAAIFGIQKINPMFSGRDISKSGYITLSFILFFAAIVSLLIAIMVRNEMDTYSPSTKMRRDEDEFSKAFTAEEPQP